MVLGNIGEFRSELGIFGNFGLNKSCAMEDTKSLYGLNEFALWKYVWKEGSINDT